jgi:hypothetical protein
MKILGIALVIAGIIALVYGFIGYDSQKTILEVGGLKATATEHRAIPWAPVVGAIAILGGVALLMVPRPPRT